MNFTERQILRYVEAGYFEIRTDGTIWRKATRRKGANKHLTWLRTMEPRRAEQPSGDYLGVTVQLRDKPCTAQAHRLIWMYFVGDIPKGLIVNHKDGNKHTNCPLNLELMTPSENAYHARDVLHIGPWKRDFHTSLAMTP